MGGGDDTGTKEGTTDEKGDPDRAVAVVGKVYEGG